MKFQKIRKFLVSVLTMAMVLTAIPVNGAMTVQAAETGTLTSVESVETAGNIATITFNDGIQAKVTFLENGIFRYNVDPSGTFDQYAKVRRGYPDTAKIQQYPDSSSEYSHPSAAAKKNGNSWEIKGGDTTIIFDENAKMTVKSGEKTVMQEQQSLQLGQNATVQTLAEQEGEQFFGGGTQNGRFVHTGKAINIANESGWTDGQVSSPNPFYYSTAGYGVLRNTWQDGKYDFGAEKDGTVTALHKENEFDAYYFVSDAENNTAVTQELLQEYFKVTGNPVLLPEYGFYLGHLNAYNRDAWSNENKSGYREWEIKGNASHESAGTTTYERGGTGTGIRSGETIETLNGTLPKDKGNMPENVSASEEFSARAVLDEYLEYDMPFGFLLPNDGYGAGYGQNGFNVTGGVTNGQSSEARLAAVAANVENLKEFADYAKSKGIATGLWTQSNLTPDSNPNTAWHLLRDFRAEVAAGVTTLKTDVAWVGPGYSFQLSGVKQGYDIVTEIAKARPNIISLDGWAGSQRFNSVWTGDQYGGNWEYIRFHIPTFIGQSLSGNPNVGSDMDGIFGGAPLIAARDYQWKSFAPQMLDMDGWGSYAKGPYVHGDPYTGISRMYLKLKAMMMPYIYTNAYAAANIDTGNGDQGLPMVRAMFLEFPEEAAAYGELAKYQYMWGENLLVAPVYEDVTADELGNDVRNGIYLPGGADQIWIDYFTGDQYRGGQILNGFDAPLWKLPLFVKNGAIIPMYEEHNVADSKAENGVDKSKRIVEFWPDGTSDFTAIEDDGNSVTNTMDDSDKEYGVIDHIDYGNRMSVKYTSVVDEKAQKATLTAEKATGVPYEGYEADKETTFIVHASKKPSAVKASNGGKALKVTEAATKEEFDAAAAADSAVYFYDAAPEIETFASEEEKILADMVKDVKVSGKLYVKFPKTDEKQELVVEGFENKGDLKDHRPNKELEAPVLRQNEEKTTPTSIALEWDAIGGNAEAEPANAKADSFKDVTPEDYFYNPVMWAASNGIVEGYGDTGKFMPYNDCTRANVVTFLWREAGSPKATGKEEKSFSDVKPEDYYYDAVMWAVSNGIVEGYGNTGKFLPDGPCTRANIVTFLWRANGFQKSDKETEFPDVKEDAYYYEALKWAVENGIVEGYGNTGKFMPDATCNRAQTVTFLYRAAGESTGEGGAVSYEIEADGSSVLYAVGNGETTFTHTGLEYASTHTYRIRSVDNNGYSEWSEPIEAKTKDDPFLNTPEPKKISWSGAIYGNHTADLAFDRIFQAGDGGFHSNNGGINEHLTVDYGNAYIFDKIEYYPRTDAGNGTVTKMRLETSLDGVHWIEHGTEEADGRKAFNLERNAETKTLDLSDPNTGDSAIGARYIRFTALESVGTFFAASEIKPYAVEGKSTFGSVWKPFRVGNIKRMETKEPTAADFTGMYLQGSRLHQSAKYPEWVENVQKEYGDINFNGISDVYDYAFTAFNVDGGTKQKGSVSGNAKLVPSKAEIKAGETFTVSVKAENVKNLNAYGTNINYDPEKIEFISAEYNDVVKDMFTQSMSAAIKYEDGTAYIHHSALNMGDKPLVNSSEELSKITLKALKDITLNDVTDVTADDFVIDLSAVTIMGPDFSFIDCTGEGGGEVDDTIHFGQNDFDITMTNEVLKTDDGSNVTKLIQQKSYDGLFNGSTGRDFEFLWDISQNHDETGALPAHVTLPATLHLDLKEEALVDKVVVYNANKANGYLTSAKAQLVYADGSKSDEIVISEEHEAYEFNFKPEQNVDKIEITFLTAIKSGGEAVTNMLTLSEIEVTGRPAGQAEVVEKEYAQDAFNITMTNDILTKDDGGNEAKLAQQGRGYANLFNNVKTYEDGSVFEFLWDWEANHDENGKLPEYVKLPTTLHFAFKQDSDLTKVVFHNRESGNGTVQSLKAEITFADGTKQQFNGGEYDSFAKEYTFAVSEENAGKKVKNIDITPLSASGDQMLTICEIDFIYTTVE